MMLNLGFDIVLLSLVPYYEIYEVRFDCELVKFVLSIFKMLPSTRPEVCDISTYTCGQLKANGRLVVISQPTIYDTL